MYRYSWNIHELPITFRKLLLPNVVFTLRPHLNLVTGFCWVSGPFLTETDASPVTWSKFSTNKNSRTVSVVLRWVFNHFFGVENQMPPPPGCAKGMPEHSEIRGPPNQTSNVQEDFGILWCLIHVCPLNLNLLAILEIIRKIIKNADSFEVSGTKWQFFPNFPDCLVRSAHTSVVVSFHGFSTFFRWKNSPEPWKRWVITIDDNLT